MVFKKIILHVLFLRKGRSVHRYSMNTMLMYFMKISDVFLGKRIVRMVMFQCKGMGMNVQMIRGKIKCSRSWIYAPGNQTFNFKANYT